MLNLLERGTVRSLDEGGLRDGLRDVVLSSIDVQPFFLDSFSFLSGGKLLSPVRYPFLSCDGALERLYSESNTFI
jgi:hypothetical protein